MAELVQRLEPLGLRSAEATMLQIIATNPGISQSALGRMLDIQRANMTPIAARLEARGIVRRLPSDGRSLGLELTDEGRTLADKARGIIDAFERDLTSRVPAEHRDHLLPALQALWTSFNR